MVDHYYERPLDHEGPDDDFVAFFRMLAVSLVVCSLVWLAFGLLAVELGRAIG
jgi:hypothetical protein